MTANIFLGNLSLVGTIIMLSVIAAHLVDVWLSGKEEGDPWEPYYKPDPFVPSRRDRWRNKKDALVRFLLGRPPYTPPWEGDD